MNKIKQYIKRFTNSPEKMVVFGNFTALSVLQVSNYVLPLITFPYLVRVLGPEKFGLVAFAQAFIQYFVMFTDYGFNLSATREVSVNRKDKNKISEIFSAVMTIKFVFTVISIFILIGFIFFIPKFRNDGLLYIFTFGMVLGKVLFPIWFFQGMERMKYITFLNIAAKLIFTISIFIFIHKSSNYIYVPLINSAGFIMAGIIGMWIVHKDFKVKFILPKYKQIKYHLKDGWYIFISTASISLYTTSNTFILGFFTNNTVVGYYAAGEKIVRVVISMFEPVFKALYPYITKLVAESRERAIKNLRKLVYITFGASFTIFLIVLTFAKEIAGLILGNEFGSSVSIIRIFSPLLFIIPIAYILANLTLLPFKMDRYFSRIYISGGAINISLLFLFLYVFKWRGEGAALANLITEFSLTFLMFFVLRKHKIKLL